MRTIAPGVQHPLYWVLVSVIGMSPADISKQTGISSHAIRRLARGHTPKDRIRRRLRALILSHHDKEPFYNVSPREAKDPRLKDYIKLTFALINQVLADTEDPARRAKRTELGDLLLAMIPARGIRRASVIAQLERAYSTTSIKRCAVRLGVIEEPDPDNPLSLLWFPPQGRPPVKELRLNPVFTPPRSKRAEQLHTLITVYLGRRHDRGIYAVKASRLLAHCIAKGHSKPSFYRAVKDLLLIRESTGFGKDKKTYYALPHRQETAE